MKKKMKQLTCLVLSLIMALSVSLPAMAATVESTDDVIIYIKGYGCAIYENNIPSEENVKFPVTADLGAIVSNSLKPILTGFASGVVTKDYSKYCDEIYNAVAPIFESSLLDKNGEASDGSGWGGDALTSDFIVSEVNTPENSILFPYDWRLSPQYNAKILEKFIDRVCKEKGVQQVDIMSRCLGSTLLNCYLEEGTNTHKVDDVVMYIPGTEGMYILGALFSGNIELDSDKLNVFLANYIETNALIEDPCLNSLVIGLVDFLNQAKILGVTADYLQDGLENIINDVFPRIILATYGTFPSFWTMIPDRYFEDAIEFTFNTPELKAEYAGIISKARDYHDNIYLKAYDTMKKHQANGMRFMVVSKYDTAMIPLGPEAGYNGDFYAETELSSFGATIAPFGETLSKDYIASMSEADKRFLSPDNKIDASTCLFPETTWFIKYCLHDHWPEPQDAMAMQFLRDKNMTVFTYSEYPQFLKVTDVTLGGDKTSGVMSPVEGPDAEEKESFIMGLASFFKKIAAKIIGFYVEILAKFLPDIT